MSQWKRYGVLVVQYRHDHAPRHVHVFEDGKSLLKFNIDDWEVISGKLPVKANRALNALREEGVFDAKRKV